MTLVKLLLKNTFNSNFTIMIAINAKWILENVRPRNIKGYKKTFGHVLVIAGSEGKLGAAILCTLAALRSGCGMVTAFIHTVQLSCYLIK